MPQSLIISIWPKTHRSAHFTVQELQALIKYIQIKKSTDSDWFTITSNKEGTHWSGKCWYIHELIKYEFDFEFDIPATYPTTAPEIKIPSLDGKTAKMYRGGAICLTVHFKPLWAKNRYCSEFVAIPDPLLHRPGFILILGGVITARV